MGKWNGRISVLYNKAKFKHSLCTELHTNKRWKVFTTVSFKTAINRWMDYTTEKFMKNNNFFTIYNMNYHKPVYLLPFRNISKTIFKIKNYSKHNFCWKLYLSVVLRLSSYRQLRFEKAPEDSNFWWNEITCQGKEI